MPTLVRWEPFRDIAQLQGEMGRLFNGLLDSQSRSSQAWVPALDVWETDSELVYAFDLPGIEEDRISVELEDNVLTVSGERDRAEKTEGDRFYRYERRFGQFSRSVTLPQGVNEDEIKADYEAGVLEVRVPKPEEQKPKRIRIGGSEQTAIEGKGTRTS